MKKRKIFTVQKDTKPNGQVIQSLIQQHKKYIADYTKLESYYDDEPQIDRKRPTDIIIYNNFAKYITTLNVGHLLGSPVEYQATKGLNIDPILDLYKDQTIADLDADLAEDCSIFGRSFELIYLNEDAQINSVKLDVYNTILVYNKNFNPEKQFGIVYSPKTDTEGKVLQDQYDVTIWTKSECIEGVLNGKDFQSTNKESHSIGVVPIIEYANNRRFKGDYESVTTGIDAYNILQSDRVMDREKLIDALLVFYGVTMTPEDKARLKTERTMALPHDSKAEYVIKNINEADAEVLRKIIASDIHKFSMTPDLSDESFAGNSSGVSLLYKLLAFEQNVKKKERSFEKGLIERFKIYADILQKKGTISSKIDIKEVDAIFKRNLPKNDYETSQMINNLRDLVDSELLVGQLSFVRDAKETVELARKEQSFEESNSNDIPDVNKTGTDTLED